MSSSSPPLPATTVPRGDLRARLLEQRSAWTRGPQAAAAEAALRNHLKHVVDALEPQGLGLYWPIRGEFNAVKAFTDDPRRDGRPLALPFARRAGRRMEYRAWDGVAPTVDDECGIPSSDGAPVDPDVVLVPCLGYTRSGFRLGYGAGYFDRWLAAHPGVTAIGVAWSVGEIAAPAQFVAQPHDMPLALVVTELGVVA